MTLITNVLGNAPITHYQINTINFWINVTNFQCVTVYLFLQIKLNTGFVGFLQSTIWFIPDLAYNCNIWLQI